MNTGRSFLMSPNAVRAERQRADSQSGPDVPSLLPPLRIPTEVTVNVTDRRSTRRVIESSFRPYSLSSLLSSPAGSHGSEGSR